MKDLRELMSVRHEKIGYDFEGEIRARHPDAKWNEVRACLERAAAGVLQESEDIDRERGEDLVFGATEQERSGLAQILISIDRALIALEASERAKKERINETIQVPRIDSGSE